MAKTTDHLSHPFDLDALRAALPDVQGISFAYGEEGSAWPIRLKVTTTDGETFMVKLDYAPRTDDELIQALLASRKVKLDVSVLDEADAVFDSLDL